MLSIESRVTSLLKRTLEALVRLTNEELAQNSSAENERLELLQVQITEVASRLGKLYEAPETGEFKSVELAPKDTNSFREERAATKG